MFEHGIDVSAKIFLIQSTLEKLVSSIGNQGILDTRLF